MLISESNLSTRTQNVLGRNGITDTDAITEERIREIQRGKRVGRVVVDELVSFAAYAAAGVHGLRKPMPYENIGSDMVGKPYGHVISENDLGYTGGSFYFLEDGKFTKDASVDAVFANASNKHKELRRNGIQTISKLLSMNAIPARRMLDAREEKYRRIIVMRSVYVPYSCEWVLDAATNIVNSLVPYGSPQKDVLLIAVAKILNVGCLNGLGEKDALGDNTIMSNVVNHIYLRSFLSNKVLEYLSTHAGTISTDQLRESVCPYIPNSIYECLLQEMGRVSINSEGISYRYPSAAEYVAKIENPMWQDVALRRLHGETLASIGETYGCTRERIRQIERRAYRDHPLFIEDILYAEAYQRYNLSLYSFKRLYKDADDTSYWYLAHTYQHGVRPAREAVAIMQTKADGQSTDRASA